MQRSGWAAFVWILYLVAGFMNAAFSLTVIFAKGWVPSSPAADALPIWGWPLFAFACVQIAVAIALVRGLGWGRTAGLVIAVIAMVVWFLLMLAVPLMGMAAITVYVLVIYGLQQNPELYR